jgi:aspartate carbamoyltransferase catalytic subunit
LKLDNLLGTKTLTKEQIIYILEKAKYFKESITTGKKSFSQLKDKTVVLAFFENSTRTRCSFELAGNYLGANIVTMTSSGSSVAKGETLIDTARTLDHMAADVIVIRHSMSGAAEYISKNVSSKIVNAGDGLHEHPTQALLDVLTIYETKKSFENLKISIIGDILHSRVARSNIHILNTLGAKVSVCGPKTLLPKYVERLNVEVYDNPKEAVADCDVVMGLRIQLERQTSGFFPSKGEYFKFYGLTEELLKGAKQDCIIMHPGPVNRDVEIASSILESKNCLVDQQVLSGVSIRMAVLDMMLGGEEEC